MKTLVVCVCFLLVAAVAYADDILAEMKEMSKPEMEECMRELNINPEDMKEGKDHEKMGCLYACVMKKLHMFKEGTLDLSEENVEAYMSGKWKDEAMKKKVVSSIVECHGEVSGKGITEECAYGAAMGECVPGKIKEA